MSLRNTIALDEIEQEIVIQNPANRICRIEAKQSGWEDEQVFTSDVFADSILAIHLKELTRKVGHPVYCLEPTKKKLILKGWYGYNYGPRLLDRICNELLSTQDICFARSIQKTDFQAFYHDGENMSYWLSSRCEKEYGLYRANKGQIDACTLFDPDGYEDDYAYSVRPVMVMNMEVVF